MGMAKIRAERALTANGWEEGVLVEFGPGGVISRVEAGSKAEGERHSILIPAAPNLHSHAFQRAMAGLAESRSGAGKDDFWAWRQLMYRFLEQLTPDDAERIAAFVQMEMLEAGFASVGEFHYLHHGPGGRRYGSVSEMAGRMAAAAERSGIGLTLLPALYERGGCDNRRLEGGQLRFGSGIDEFAEIVQQLEGDLRGRPDDFVLGAAMHSMRAVRPETAESFGGLFPDRPLHVHSSEQLAEVEQVQAETGMRPVEWLLDFAGADRRWCLIHCTHMTEAESVRLAEAGATAGLCPVTESNLGDGVFDGIRFLRAGGSIGVGTDSNVRVSQTGEYRSLEYSQRLTRQCRSALAIGSASTGRAVFDACAKGGAKAIGRPCGSIAAGMLADLVELDGGSADLEGLEGDAILDAWIFAGRRSMVRTVWSAGRKVVRDGAHQARPELEELYRRTASRLRGSV